MKVSYESERPLAVAGRAPLGSRAPRLTACLFMVGVAGVCAGVCAAADAVTPVSDAHPVEGRPTPPDARTAAPTPDAAQSGAVSELALTPLHGLALPWQEAELGMETSRVIADMFVTEGQRVEQGQPLLEFDARVATQQVRVSEAAAQRQAAAVREAELERTLAHYRQRQIQGAFQAGASTAGEDHEATVRLEQAEAAVDAARQALAEALARAELARVERQRFTLRAPFAGVVMRVDAALGEVTAATQPVITLADLSRLRAELQLPAAQLAQLRQQHRWRLRAGAPFHQLLEARLIAVEPRINPATQTVRCLFEIPNPDQLPAGFPVSLP